MSKLVLEVTCEGDAPTEEMMRDINFALAQVSSQTDWYLDWQIIEDKDDDDVQE